MTTEKEEKENQNYTSCKKCLFNETCYIKRAIMDFHFERMVSSEDVHLFIFAAKRQCIKYVKK